MNIYESLENLNVSEECFEDIMGIVEELLSESLYSQAEKTGKLDSKLDRKINEIKVKEFIEASKREGNGDFDKGFNKVYDKRNPHNTKAGKQDEIREISKLIKKYPEDDDRV